MKSKNSETGAGTPYAYALRLLASRDYSAAALREKLLKRGFSPSDTDDGIERLLQGRLLDDHRYAARFAEAAVAAGRYTGLRLRAELRKRGIPADLIEAVLADIRQGDSQAEGLNAVISRRFPRLLDGTADLREKRRAAGFLQRRGFSMADIMRAVRPETIYNQTYF